MARSDEAYTSIRKMYFAQNNDNLNFTSSTYIASNISDNKTSQNRNNNTNTSSSNRYK